MRILTGVMLLALGTAPAFAASRTIELPPFTSIDISSGIHAEVTVGGSQSVTADSADQSVIDELRIEVRGSTLHAWYEWSIFDVFRIGRDRSITLTIAVPSVDALDASAGALVNVGGLSGDRVALGASSGASLNAIVTSVSFLDLEASSGAALSASGPCVAADVEVSSGARVTADSLLCTDVDAEASSGAQAKVFASGSVKAEASSGGQVIVHGNPPSVDREASSGGNVELAH